MAFHRLHSSPKASAVHGARLFNRDWTRDPWRNVDGCPARRTSPARFSLNRNDVTCRYLSWRRRRNGCSVLVVERQSRGYGSRSSWYLADGYRTRRPPLGRVGGFRTLGGAIRTTGAMRRLHPTRDDVRAATRVTVSVVVPMVVLRLAGHPQWVLYSTFAAFASVYGRGESPRRRIATQLSVSVLLTGLIIAATATATAADARWWSLLGVSVAAAISTAASHRWAWRPAGALFAVFAFGAVSSVPATSHDVMVATVVALATSAFALLVSCVISAFTLVASPVRMVHDTIGDDAGVGAG